MKGSLIEKRWMGKTYKTAIGVSDEAMKVAATSLQRFTKNSPGRFPGVSLGGKLA